MLASRKFMTLSALVLITVSCFCASTAFARTVPFIVGPSGGFYEVPTHPNPMYGATYSCLVFDLKEIRRQGDLWIHSVDPRVDSDIVHHAVAYAIPFGSSLNLPGGYLYGKQSGDIIEDCFHPTQSQPLPGVPYAWQHGNPTFDLLGLYDSDRSTANGYSYGIPIGTQTNYEWLIIQAHFHNPYQKEDLKTNPRFFFQATTDAPDQNAGVMVGGIFPHNLIIVPPYASNYKTSALMPSPTPSYESCFPVPTGHPLAPLHAGLSEQITYVAGEGQRDYIDVLISGLHAHNAQKVLRNWIVHQNGTYELIDECERCGHHGSNNFHVLDEPKRIKAGDGFLVECVYDNSGNPDPILGGFNTHDEMCRSWNLVAPVPASGATLYFVDECQVCLGGIVGQNQCTDPLGQHRPLFCSPRNCPP